MGVLCTRPVLPSLPGPCARLACGNDLLCSCGQSSFVLTTDSHVLLMNIFPSMSVLSAGEYLTVFVSRRLEFAFVLLDLDPSPYCLKNDFLNNAYNPQLYPDMGD